MQPATRDKLLARDEEICRLIIEDDGTMDDATHEKLMDEKATLEWLLLSAYEPRRLADRKGE